MHVLKQSELHSSGKIYKSGVKIPVHKLFLNLILKKYFIVYYLDVEKSSKEELRQIILK